MTGGSVGRISDERGVVLLVVLTVVALLTIIVTEFTYDVQLDQHRARNALDALRASLLARSALNIEESFLLADKDEQGKYDAYTEEWWLALQQFCTEGVELDETTRMECQLEDESGKLNVNLTRTTPQAMQALRGERKTRDSFARDALRRIFEAQEIDVDLVDKLLEYWLQDPQTNGDGKHRKIPDFSSLEEFASTLGIPTRKLAKLRRILTAVPTRYLGSVNANTAPGIVLAAIGNDSNGVAAIAEQQRSEEPFKNTSQVRQRLQEEGVADAAVVGGLFGVRSRLFRLRAAVLTNTDPSGEIPGGIGQTLSELVTRRRGRCRPGQKPPCWTLKPLDWQKEGGASLTRDDSDDDGVPDDGEGVGELDGAAFGR